MAKELVTVELTGVKEILGDLDVLAEQFPEMVKECTEEQQKVIKQAMKSNWVSIAGGKSGDFVYDSVSFSTTYGSNTKDVIGTVGVYNLDSVAAAHGRVFREGKKKPMNAAQIAYWVEFGTSRHRSGRRKVEGEEYKPEDLVRIAGKPFITQSFYGTLDKQQKAFADKWNELLNRKLS